MRNSGNQRVSFPEINSYDKIKDLSILQHDNYFEQ